MPLVQQDLGSQVLGSPAQSVGSGLHVLGKTEISELQVAVLGQQKVLRLQVAEDDILVVEVFEYEDNLGRVEAAEETGYLA